MTIQNKKDGLPTEIDGALVQASNVLVCQHKPTGFTTHYATGIELLSRIAICKYKQDLGCYLFYCDSNWNVINDTHHDSKELAIDKLN